MKHNMNVKNAIEKTIFNTIPRQKQGGKELTTNAIWPPIDIIIKPKFKYLTISSYY